MKTIGRSCTGLLMIRLRLIDRSIANAEDRKEKRTFFDPPSFLMPRAREKSGIWICTVSKSSVHGAVADNIG